MVLIQQSAILETKVVEDEILQRIETAGRTCYKSEEKITSTSSVNFFLSLLKSGHHSVLEHVNLTVRFITNRGVTHELVRHRLASYSQESTRYCNYGSQDITFILPVWWELSGVDQRNVFIASLQMAENMYKGLLDLGWVPQQAREVLPNALKTEIVMTANLREWMHVFELRCSKAAHPQIRYLMLDLLRTFAEKMPRIFGHLADKFLHQRESDNGR